MHRLLSCLYAVFAHIKQLHYPLDNLDVRRSVAALFVQPWRVKLVKLRFPVFECVYLHVEHFCYLAYFVVGFGGIDIILQSRM